MRQTRRAVTAFLRMSITKVFLALKDRCVNKYWAEMRFWRKKRFAEGGRFRNDHYEGLLLALADQHDETFVSGKVVADFGCGPAGTLTWAGSAALRIGIDVLADRFADEFQSDIL